MLVDFRGFKRIVDAIGGVEICLKEPVDDPLSGLKLDTGKHVVEGEEALAFVRARKTLGDGSDTSRIRRQQAFISSLMRKVLSSGTLLNPASLLGVLDAATESLTADPQMADINNLKDLALSLKDLKPAQRHLHDAALDAQRRQRDRQRQRREGEADLGRDEERHRHGRRRAARARTPSLLKTAPENIRVNVLNGTPTPGKAKKVAKQLRKQGFIVEEVGNAETTDYTATTVQYDPA